MSVEGTRMRLSRANVLIYCKISIFQANIIKITHKNPTTPKLFDEIKHRHKLNEVGDVAGGRYDRKMDRGRSGISV